MNRWFWRYSLLLVPVDKATQFAVQMLRDVVFLKNTQPFTRTDKGNSTVMQQGCGASSTPFENQSFHFFYLPPLYKHLIFKQHNYDKFSNYNISERENFSLRCRICFWYIVAEETIPAKQMWQDRVCGFFKKLVGNTYRDYETPSRC